MKRYNNLFERAFTMENIYEAYIAARRGKRSRRACFEFEKNLGENLSRIQSEIQSGTYVPDPYVCFTVTEPKTRIIYAPTFRDVVVQHAIYRTIYSTFDRSFIAESFACRIGYGTHKAARYARTAMQAYSGDSYVLKLDVRKFFYTINREVLRCLIERKIKDKRFVNIMMMFAHMETPLGIPIGNLLSQIFALIYLNPLDHYIKRELKIKHYVRYVDDFLLVGLTRNQCLEAKSAIVEFIKTKLHLGLSRCTISKIRKGINFCGYRMWRSLVFIRKYSLYKFRRMVKKGNQEAINSLLGHAKNTNSMPYMMKIIWEGNANGKNIQIPKNYRRCYNVPTNRAGLQPC